MLIWFWLVQLSVVLANQDFYKNNENIFELHSGNFDKVVRSTNYTTIVEFYAPWCGYCKQLKPVYEKLGRFMASDSKLAVNVATVNCDRSVNKQLCAKEQVTGFPTIKIYRPPKVDLEKPSKSSRHASEIYNGERGLKSIINFVNSRIKNYVKKVKADTVNEWIEKKGDYKVILVTESTSVTPMLKTLAIDFLGEVEFSYIHAKSSITIDLLDQSLEVTERPTIFFVNKQTNEVRRWEGGKDKVEISKWIMESGVTPVEGILSKKGKASLKYRLGKKKIVHDEL
ncbi:protein disulfide-isomerase Mpd1p [[Candida] jaroonii]|uniref:Protein disulfide-isomerase Mpd1p n=1 Tax=[Candida] jaroonii TaxID=467808 RepID=A0ACA9YFQ3_9ASCO|nr:protein disulfide-isomerase Mpd1p [[Candida] jaroonii]